MKILAVVALGLAAVGCAVEPVYLNKDIYSVAVLPPFNSSNYLEATDKMWGHVEARVAARGYRLIPRSTIQAFYQKHKYTQAEEIKQYAPDELAKEWNVDALVYSNITKWDRVTLILYTHVGVALEAELVEGKSGNALWRGEGEAGDSEAGRDAVAASVGNVVAGLGALERFCGPASADCFKTLPLPGHAPKPEEQKK